MLEVTYRTTVDDYVTWSLYAFNRSPSLRRRFLVSWIGLAAVMFAGAACFWFTSGPLGAAIAGFFGVLYLAVYPLWYRQQTADNVRRIASDLGVQGVIGKITLTLTDESMTEQTSTSQTVVRWDRMHSVEAVGDCTYIFVTGLSAAIIPRHGFDDPSEYEAVRDFAMRKLGPKE